jgi:hypothetical protein
MKWKFSPSDFDLDADGYFHDEAARQANLKLDEWRKQATVVIGNPEIGTWSDVGDSADTHRALLIDITELPKEPCKHEPNIIQVPAGMGMVPFYTDTATCKHCGVKLKASWEAAK